MQNFVSETTKVNNSAAIKRHKHGKESEARTNIPFYAT